MTRLEHVGIAVHDPSSVKRLLEQLLEISAYKEEFVGTERVTTHFVDAGSVKLELLESAEDDSAVARFLQRRGEGIHHLAFEVDDLQAALARAKSIGLTPIHPQPVDGADGKRIFFLHPKETHGVLIEICRSNRFTGRSVERDRPTGTGVVYETGRDDAPAILFIHDVGGSAVTEFGGLMSVLEPSLRILAFDEIATEAVSDLPRNGLLQARAAQAVAVMDELRIPSAVIAGRAVGSAVALVIAREHPDRTNGLALLDANLLITSEDVDQAADVFRQRNGATIGDEALSMSGLRTEIADIGVLSIFQSIRSRVLLVSTGERSRDRTLRLHHERAESTLAVLPESTSPHILGSILFEFVRTVST